MKAHFLLPAAIAAAGLAACGQPNTAPAEAAAPAASEAHAPAAPAGPAFHHDAAFDAFGYYMPASDVQVGSLKLAHLHVGIEDDLKGWEAGTGRLPEYAPVMLVFDDVSSARVRTELGEAYSVSIRVKPTRYAVSKEALSFAGSDPRLGAVTFEGRFDQAALSAAKAGEGADGTVLTGRLTVGGKTFDPARFTWFGGD